MGDVLGGRRSYRCRGQRLPVGGMCLTDRDRAILRTVFLQRAVTRKQLMSLGYFHSLTAASERLRMLFDHGLLNRHSVSTDLATVELVYTVGMRAVHELSSMLGVDVVDVRRSVSSGAPFALSHAIAVTDVRIEFLAHPAEFENIEWLSEIEVRHEFTVNGAQYVLKPDGAILFDYDGKRQIAFLELDRGHVSRPQFKRSCHTYRTYFDLRLAEDVYGVQSATLLGIVHSGERRLRSLLGLAGNAGLFASFASWSEVTDHGVNGAVWRTAQEQGNKHKLTEVLR